MTIVVPRATGLDIPALATLVLATINEQFADAGVQLPARQYVAAGAATLIAWDAEQLVVSLGNIRSGVTSQGSAANAKIGVQAAHAGLRTVQLDVQLVRCVPTMTGSKPPAADVIHRAGLSALRDAGLLSQAMVRCQSTARGALMAGSNVSMLDLTPFGPEGGVAGWQTGLTTNGLAFT